MLIPHN